jgi:hypothetical protein
LIVLIWLSVWMDWHFLHFAQLPVLPVILMHSKVEMYPKRIFQPSRHFYQFDLSNKSSKHTLSPSTDKTQRWNDP